ncbi:hypothetical protein K432DRAFT_127461 [Lepidopterella palustris CBS 459.81]|uniref:Uncharacterized protein n=1 Tax=Lepidopterella palustris CBS 459.81 TaxID=1314670 RepID=A0A8E2E4P8_9PEZI|nr:hypothetical protein K432DRAFT_127461 [Lepidopterella palustris CBS 459.81]
MIRPGIAESRRQNDNLSRKKIKLCRHQECKNDAQHYIYRWTACWMLDAKTRERKEPLQSSMWSWNPEPECRQMRNPNFGLTDAFQGLPVGPWIQFSLGIEHEWSMRGCPAMSVSPRNRFLSQSSLQSLSQLLCSPLSEVRIGDLHENWAV